MVHRLSCEQLIAGETLEFDTRAKRVTHIEPSMLKRYTPSEFKADYWTSQSIELESVLSWRMASAD